MYDRETQTGIYPALICENGASAALAMVASFLRASQMQVFAQCIEQSHARVELERIILSINLQVDVHYVLQGARFCFGGLPR
jgi:hypothetical protein